MSKHRIQLLDGFRFIALLLVLLYHFTARWASLYPYGHSFGDIFSEGYVGVYFFFMISGFVISYTLENTPDLRSFFGHRFSRLFPPMLLCSVLTFLVARLLDDHSVFPNAHDPKNFLPALTFVQPSVWFWLTGHRFGWISGSYWSLWVEIQFYVIASVVYFLNKKQFFRNLLITGIVISLIKYIPIWLLHSLRPILDSYDWSGFFAGWRHGSEMFNISFFILWFLAGVFFYQLYRGFRFARDRFSGACAVFVCLFIVAEARIFSPDSFYHLLFACVLMFALFLLMIYRREYLSWLENPFLRRIGVISYSIYLIHEDIGVLLINKYGGALGRFSVLSPLIVMVLVTVFAELSYRFYEQRASGYLKGIFR